MRRQLIRLVIACMIPLTLCSCSASNGTFSRLSLTVLDYLSRDTLLENQILITGGISTENGGTDVDVSNGYEKISFDEINQFKGTFHQYNPKYYYKFLSEKEQLLYNIFIYMAENGHENIFFSLDLVDPHAIEKAMYCFVSDYPSMESNIDYEGKSSEISISDEPHPGYFMHLTAYRKDKNEKNLQALKKAEEIVTNMPQQLSDKDKAAYLFRYLVEHVSDRDMDEKDTVYLYSALCEEASNCDGFANAYSLLCNMVGLECIKVIYRPDELKAYLETHTELGEFYKDVDRGSGHIWNMVKIDGKYYHYDAYASMRAMERENVPSEILMGASDRVALRGVEYQPDISPYVPSSTSCLYLEEPLALTEEHYEDDLAAIRTQLKENLTNGKNYGYFLLEGKLLNNYNEIYNAIVAGYDSSLFDRSSTLPNRQGEILIIVYRK